MIINRGDKVIVTCEPYSDYAVLGVYVALEDIDCIKAKEAFQEISPDNYLFQEFVDSLEKTGKLQKIKWKEWWLGEYGRLDRMQLTDEPKIQM